MEESKELQGSYKVFRIAIYVSLMVEFFEYAFNPEVLDVFGGVVTEIHRRIGQWLIYLPGNIAYSKVTTLLLVIITCIGTKNKKQMEFDARKQVFWPLVAGFILTLISVYLYYNDFRPMIYMMGLNIWLYMFASVIGTILIHVALDNVSKYLKDSMLKDRFNFENESFEQCEDLNETKYSVNIPMRYYFKGKFRHGWINIDNPFRGRRRTNRAISVKLIHWLKLNVNNLKSAIWVKQRKITENIRKGMTSGWLGTSVGNYRFCFPKFPTNLRTLTGLNSIILSQFGMCK